MSPTLLPWRNFEAATLTYGPTNRRMEVKCGLLGGNDLLENVRLNSFANFSGKKSDFCFSWKSTLWTYRCYGYICGHIFFQCTQLNQEGMARIGHFWQNLVSLPMEVSLHRYVQLKQGGTCYYGHIDSLTLYLRKINDHRGGKSMWAVHEQCINELL